MSGLTTASWRGCGCGAATWRWSTGSPPCWGSVCSTAPGYSAVQYSTVQYSTVQCVQVGVVVQYSASRLRDFTGVLEQREHSHTHLNLTLVGAAGTITGTVAGQQVQIYRCRYI